MSQLLATAERDQETRFLKESEFGFHPRVPYVRSRYVIMGEAILRAIDAGLLPADYEIRWDRVIRRAYTELLTGGWSESDVKQAVEALRVLSQNMGCPEVMVEAESASPPRALAVNHPEVLVAHEPPWEWILATQPLGIEGVHDAARLAEGLIAWMEGNATDPRACRILENGVLGGILREGSRQLGELRGGMQIEAVDRERANIQWAKTKTKLEGARQKQTELKDKVEALRAERSRPKTLLGRVSQKLFKRKQSR